MEQSLRYRAMIMERVVWEGSLLRLGATQHSWGTKGVGTTTVEVPKE